MLLRAVQRNHLKALYFFYDSTDDFGRPVWPLSAARVRFEPVVGEG